MAHEMSAHQLDEMWHLEFKWANELLELPLRKCSAVPSAWGTPMKDEDFQQLKLHVKRMWLRAAIMFKCSYSDVSGWGLKVNDMSEKNLSLTLNSFTMLGWLVRVPDVSQCQTAHRYLRSPVAKHLYLGENFYLGGPLSLANWSNTPTIKGIRSDLKTLPGKFGYQVATLKPMPPGTEVTWNYGLHIEPNLNPKNEWQLDACCSEGVQPFHQMVSRYSGQPSKRLRIIQAFRFCTYCGMNLEDNEDSSEVDPTKEPTKRNKKVQSKRNKEAQSGVDPTKEPTKRNKKAQSRVGPTEEPTKRNIKAHIALHHTVQVCFDQGLDVADVHEGVTKAAFFSQLHLVNKVLASLEAHNYSPKPACHFLRNHEPLQDDESKVTCFKEFSAEAKLAFKTYQVVYLRGITVPSSYEELLPVKETDYADVCWEGVTPPRSNLFSVAGILSEEQKNDLDREILVHIQSIIKTYADM